MRAKPSSRSLRLADLCPRRDFVIHNPACLLKLRIAGLKDAEDFDTLTGDIISGHAYRHVIAGRIGKRRVILKREHRITWKTRVGNWLAGFHRSSLAQREAIVLDSLARAGVSVPEWMAFGEFDGRAFLLLRREGGHDLRRVLCRRLPACVRGRIAQNIGCSVARVLQAGFTAPDLSAKHILVRRDRSVVLLDWPRAQKLRSIRISDCVTSLARLHASIAPQLISSRERLIVVRSCLRQLGMSASAASVARQIDKAAARLRGHRSVDEQWQRPRNHAGERLRWIDGEQLCVTRSFFQSVNDKLPLWLRDAAKYSPRRTRINCHQIADNERSWMCQTQPVSKWRRILSRVTRRPIRSSSLVLAGLLFRLRRYGVPVARVLAFGGRTDGGGFVLTKDHGEVQNLRHWLANTKHGRSQVLRSVGRLLQRFHAAGCAGIDGDLLAITTGLTPKLRLHVDFNWRKSRGISTRETARDLRGVALDLGLHSRSDMVRLVQGYVGNEPLRRKHLQLANDVLQLSIRRAA